MKARSRRPLSKHYIYLYDEVAIADCLDWSQHTQLTENAASLTFEQSHLLDLVNLKREEYADRFKRGNYFSNAYPIIAAEAPFATRFVCCGRKTAWNGTGSCQKWRFCSRCAYARQRATLETFLPAYQPSSFVFVTLAFNGSLAISHADDLAAVIPLWNAIDAALKRLRSLNQIEGAFYVEEVAIIGFLPLRLQPHVHAILHTPNGKPDTPESIRKQLGRSLRNLALSPSIEVAPLTSEECFANRLTYTTKAIDLVSRYRAALYNDGSANLHSRLQVNHELRAFLHGWTQVTHARHAIRRLGTMHHASGHYIGMKDWTAAQRKEYVYQFYAELMEQRKSLPEAA